MEKQHEVNGVDLAALLKSKDSKEYQDFRDRAAYVYATGTFPTHLRRFFTALLAKATRYQRHPVSLDSQFGSMKITPQVARALKLEEHPMIRKAREYVNQGYRIRVARELTARRPYSKLFLYARARTGTKQVTVQADGSVKEGWA
jgi:hypothetical protein